jgi:hypothetical protein
VIWDSTSAPVQHLILRERRIDHGRGSVNIYYVLRD